MTTRFAVWGAVLGTLAAVSAGTAQQIASAGPQRGPRFLLASAQGNVAADVSQAPILGRRLSLDLDGVTRKQALTAIVRQTGLKLVYGDDLLGLDGRVRLRAENITVAAALTDVLWDAGFDVVFSANQQAVLARRTKPAALPTGEIVGRIRDAKTSDGVARAEVFLEKAHWRTLTDTAGWYRLVAVDTGHYTLTVRRLGYAKRSQAVTVQDNRVDTVDVALEPVVARLEELVTTATGPRRRLDIANDITTINADSVMQAAPIRSVTDLLETRVPGLTVQRTSGAPGDPARLRLRGASSIRQSNDPIVFVDGVRVYAEQSAARSGNLAASATKPYAAPSPLDYIDPNTIESIEVFKGPSASTLYGPDAANGVIVITTKKGKPGRTRWSGSVQQSRTQMAGDYPNLFYRWGRRLYTGQLMRCSAYEEAARLCVGDSMPSFQLLNDPALTVLGKGHRTTGSLTALGGNQALTYAVTGTFGDDIGLIQLPGYEADRYRSSFHAAPPDWMRRPQRFKQWGITSNITARLGDKADVSLQAKFSRSDQQRSSLEQDLGNLMSTYLDRSSGTYYQFATVGTAADGIGGRYFTPTTIIKDYFQRVTDAATEFTNGLSLGYRPKKWLTVSANAGLNVIQRTDEAYIPRGLQLSETVTTAPTSIDTGGHFTRANARSVVSTVNFLATALQPLGRGFQFRASAGINYTGTSTNDLRVDLDNLTPGTVSDPIGNGNEGAGRLTPEVSDATFGWFIEPSIGNNKFNFTSGLRLDGGSSFGSNVSGLSLPKFPKLGFTYLVSDESWFPLKGQVQSLRLRISYGRASRQPDPKDKFRLYGLPAQILVDSLSLTTVELASLGNTEIRPERTAELEGGFDADLLDSRLTLSFTGYRKTTDDELQVVPLAPSVYGDVSIVKNIGLVRNTGVDFQVNGQLLRGSSVTWQAGLTFSRIREILVRLAPGMDAYYSDLVSAGRGGLRIAPGYPLFGRWARPILGYADANRNGVLEAAEVQLGDTAVYVGSTTPNYAATATSTLSLWHGALTIDAALTHQNGLSQRNETALRLAPFSASRQIPGTPLNEQVGTLDLVTKYGSDYNFIQTVSTTRLHSLSVRYSVPVVVARRLGAEQLSIALQGSNLRLWTNYRGLDPNVNAFGTGNNVSDTGVLPQPRTWQVRVSAIY